MATVEKMKDMAMKQEYPSLGAGSGKKKKYYPSLSVEDMDTKGKSVGDEINMHAKCKIIEVSQEEGRPKRIRLEVREAGLNGKNKEVEDMPYHKDHKGKKGMHKMPGEHNWTDSKKESSDKKEWGEKGWQKKKGKKVKKGKRGRTRGKKIKKEEEKY